jgi:hypothetical protein
MSVGSAMRNAQSEQQGSEDRLTTRPARWREPEEADVIVAQSLVQFQEREEAGWSSPTSWFQ